MRKLDSKPVEFDGIRIRAKVNLLNVISFVRIICRA